LANALTGTTYGVRGVSRSTSGRGVYGVATADSGETIGVYGESNSPDGYGVYCKGRLHTDGNFTATGTKSALVWLPDGEGVKLYAMESSENWFEEVGSAKLDNGVAVVRIDPTFAQTVNLAENYHVFMNATEDCKGLYATKKTDTSFEVREHGGGTSNVEFSYRLLAKRRGFENERLARIQETRIQSGEVPAGNRANSEKDQTVHAALSEKLRGPLEH
jgi:hypothetical protein